MWGTSSTRRERPPLELADVVRAFGPAYRAQHRLAGQQDRALRAIEHCRTAALGGHAVQCDACGAVEISFNSCRNRHCPKCQTRAKERWLARQCADLLPVPYFHLVFTLPHALNPLAQGNPTMIYDTLFAAAAETLQAFGRDPKWLGGELGITLVLHTWGQNLDQHVHVHGVVTGGALSVDGRWVPAKAGFLFPVRALSRVFRGKYLERLQHALAQGTLKLAGAIAALAEPAEQQRFLAALRNHDWVVYAKRPFAGPEQVLAYLGRYTHRVALTNQRLVSCEDGQVQFRWRDYAHGNKLKVMALEGTEFLRRFLLHVLPAGFQRIRHYGLLANRDRAAHLARCRQALNALPPAPPVAETAAEFVLRVTGVDIALCRCCQQGRLRLCQLIAPRPLDPPTPRARSP